MPAPGVIRDSFFGELVYNLSGRRKFRHIEEMSDFEVPKAFDESYADMNPSRSSSRTNTFVERPADEESGVYNGDTEERRSQTLGPDTSYNGDEPRASEDRPAEKGVHVEKREADIQPDVTESLIVDWYGPNDPECPRNVGTPPLFITS